jgi:hypothetical protein
MSDWGWKETAASLQKPWYVARPSSEFSVVPTWMNDSTDGLCTPIHVDAAPVGEDPEMVGTSQSALS